MGFALCHSGELLFTILKLKTPAEKHRAYGLFYMSVALFFGACEVAFRLVLRRWRRFRQHPMMVSYEFVEQEVAQGRKVMVFEDLVLDVGPFGQLHPCSPNILDSFVGMTATTC